jgi:hypothetical protein
VPSGTFAEHRDEVPLVIDVGDGHRKRPRAARYKARPKTFTAVTMDTHANRKLLACWTVRKGGV